jgi:hypothetical protein
MMIPSDRKGLDDSPFLGFFSAAFATKMWRFPQGRKPDATLGG